MMVVDTLKTVRRLKEAGFSEEQAEILTEIIFDGAPHGPSMPPAAINGEDHAPGPNFGVQPSGAAAHPPPGAALNGHERIFPGSFSNAHDSRHSASSVNGVNGFHGGLNGAGYHGEGRHAGMHQGAYTPMNSQAPMDTPISQETRLIRWVVPLVLAQGVLVWGLAQLF